jgi:N-acetylglucosaminyldiphosphoundecaprenol N-acetyl-beta-D-mannosaminyltransferase
MLDYGKQNIIGVGVDAVDYEAAVSRIISAARDRRRYAVSALAVHGVMTGALNDIHRHRLNKLDLVVPDGQPVRWAMNWLYGIALPDRVYGPNLTLKVCERAANEGLGVYLYGSRPKVLRAFEKNLTAKFPGLRIVGSQPSRFRSVSAEEQYEIAREINESGASIVLVGLGCPRQETWVFENRDLISMPLIAVGAAFDFHAGNLSQAPRWLQDRGLEWVYRLLQEPGRLWRRYAYTNPLYLLLVLLQLLKIRTRALEDNVAPVSKIRFG